MKKKKKKNNGKSPQMQNAPNPKARAIATEPSLPSLSIRSAFTTGQSLISEYYFLFNRNMHKAIYNTSYNIDLRKWGEGVKKKKH